MRFFRLKPAPSKGFRKKSALIGFKLIQTAKRVPDAWKKLVAEVLYSKRKIRLLWFINDCFERPRELQRKIPYASRRVLTIQLKELEEHQLISKIIFAQVPPKVEYSLTDFGKTLIRVISALGNWGDEHEIRLRNIILQKSEAG